MPGISRAALCLHFPTKEGLFRAGARRAHAGAVARADEALAGPGDTVSRINTAMTAYFGGVTTQISSNVHGAGTLRPGLSVAGDVVSASHETLVSFLVFA